MDKQVFAWLSQGTKPMDCLKEQGHWENIQPKFSTSGSPHAETDDRPNTPELELLER